MVICLEPGADLHIAQLMPLPLTVSCFSKIQIGFTFLVPAHPGSPGQGPLNGIVCLLLFFVVRCLIQSQSWLSSSCYMSRLSVITGTYCHCLHSMQSRVCATVRCLSVPAWVPCSNGTVSRAILSAYVVAEHRLVTRLIDSSLNSFVNFSLFPTSDVNSWKISQHVHQMVLI